MVQEDKVDVTTRFVELLATVGSFLLVLVTLPFSLCFAFKVVQEYERAVVFRMGRLKGEAYGPGTFFVMPCVDNCVRVDMRTVSFDVPPQEVLTKDSVTVSVDAVVYYRIKEPLNAVIKIANYSHSTRLLAASTLRTVLGTRSLAEILAERETVSHTMQASLDEATDPWGVMVERVEIKDVRLPVQLQRAMATEAEAAREARAKVIAAEGEMLASRALKEASDVISTSPAALQTGIKGLHKPPQPSNNELKRIKYAMAHLTHKQYIDLLAEPNWRKIRKIDLNLLANPFTTRRAALKARASKRIRVLARPKYVNKKYDPTKVPPPYPRIHPLTLAATSSKRILDLALPKKRLLLSNMGFPTSGNIVQLLYKVENSRYLKYRFFCNARQQRELKRKNHIMARLRRTIKPEDWNRHLKVLERLATPKLPPRPKFPDRRRKWRPLNMRRIEDLATPAVRETPEVRDPFTVPPAALTYQISKRIVEIAYPKTVPEITPPRIPGTVSPAALKAVASPRTIFLAKPAVRPAGMETDLREDAFQVSPKALKAKASKRLKFLARPKTYRR